MNLINKAKVDEDMEKVEGEIDIISSALSTLPSGVDAPLHRLKTQYLGALNHQINVSMGVAVDVETQYNLMLRSAAVAKKQAECLLDEIEYRKTKNPETTEKKDETIN